MSREVNPSILAALSQSIVEPLLAIELMFDTSPVRFWFGVGDITINGNVYTGSGLLLNISQIEETGDVQAGNVDLMLSGVPTTLIAVALSEPYQGRRATIYFGSLRPTIAVAEVFTGFMDRMDIDESPETCRISMSIENELVDLERVRVRRFTNNDQQSRFPGDRGLEFIEALQDKEIFWGRASA
jgi:hypothetical protein